MLFREYAERWESEMTAVTAPSTQRARRQHLKTHLLPALGLLPIENVNQGCTQSLIGKLTEGLEPKTVTNVWGTLRCILTDAERDGLIVKVPKPRFKRSGANEQPRFTPEQARELVRATSDPEMKALLFLLAETGARIDEALNLWKTNLSDSGILQVDGTKTTAARRSVSVSRHLQMLMRDVDALRAGSPASYEYFPKCETTYREKLSFLVRKLDIQVLEAKAPFHAFRRMSCTLAAELGMPEDVNEYRLGHALKGVRSKYRFFTPGSDREWAEKIAAVLQ